MLDTSENFSSSFWIAFVLGLCLATGLYGFQTIDPRQYAWMLHGDAAQHLNGLSYFLAEPWHWPPGAMSGFGGPGSVVFTDSIPWLALLLKLIHWPSDWQVFGLWIVLCHGLAASLSTYWLQMHRVTASVAICYGIILAFAPMILLRAYGHESLMAHFLLPGALILSIRRWSAWRWAAWLILSIGIHAYWVVMVGFFAISATIFAGLQKHNQWKQLSLEWIFIILMLLTSAYLLGYGVGDGSRSSEGFGYYSANLLTWLDPMDWYNFLLLHNRPVDTAGAWSYIFPPIGHSTTGQYEGFAWLGAGVFLLALSAAWLYIRSAIYFVKNKTLQPSSITTPWTTWLAASLLAVWSWSHIWGVGGHVLVSWSVPGPVMEILGVFRASGRFIWPLSWMILLFICLIASRWRHAWMWAGTALLLQAIDMSPKLSEFYHRFQVQMPMALMPLNSSSWQPMLRNCSHVQLLAPRVQESSTWAPVAWQAAQAGASIYPVPTARLNTKRQSEIENLLDVLSNGQQWSPKSVYVTWPDALSASTLQALLEASEFAMPMRQVHYWEGYTVIADKTCFTSVK